MNDAAPFSADPGSILFGAQRETCRAWPDQREITIRSLHFVQGDSPVEIGRGMRALLTQVSGGG